MIKIKSKIVKKYNGENELKTSILVEGRRTDVMAKIVDITKYLFKEVIKSSIKEKKINQEERLKIVGAMVRMIEIGIKEAMKELTEEGIIDKDTIEIVLKEAKE